MRRRERERERVRDIYSVFSHNLYLGYINSWPARFFHVDRPKDEVLVG